MGIVEDELANFQLSDGTRWTIELNKSGQIHIHMDNLKIQLSQDEFCEIVDAIAVADSEIQEMKAIKNE